MRLIKIILFNDRQELTPGILLEYWKATMKLLIIVLTLFSLSGLYAQVKSAPKDPPVPCSGSVDALPGKYTDHTNPKYPSSLKGTAQDKAAMTKQLIAIEKMEEASRTNFQLTGCVARVSFSGGNKNIVGGYAYTYGYQLGLYQNVCHVTEKVVKTVGEYRSVLRVDVNPGFGTGNYYGEYGDFYVTDKKVRYDIPIDARLGVNYDKDRFNNNRSQITRYISEEMVLIGRSDNYKDKHGDFLKLINGDGYVENWMHGSREDKITAKSYQWIDRHYIITKPGVPLLVPVTRKAYLEALLEYYEIEKVNFQQAVTDMIANDSRTKSICEADKAAYQKIYETKKVKVQQVIASSTFDWLKQPAVVIKYLKPDDYSKASNGLLDFERFYDGDPKGETLYQYNPEYFKTTINQPLKPMLMEVQIRYELGEDSGFSKRYFGNFLNHYDLQKLREMLN